VSQGLGSYLPAQGSSGAVMCPRGPDSRLRAAPAPASRLEAALEPPCVPVASAPTSWLGGGSGAATYRLGSSTCLLTQGSSGAATCPKDGLYML
jgi:hypothetical protein